MKILKKIFIWIFDEWKNFFLTIGIIYLLVLGIKYHILKNDYDNIKIETSDSLKIYKNKIGDLYTERETFIANIKDLKRTNKDLADEVKNLKDNPIIVTKVKTNIKYKDIGIKDTVYVDPSGKYTLPIKFKDNWCDISGKSLFDIKTMIGETKLDSLSFVNNITLDLIEKDKKLSFIAKSDNPYCKINSLNGSIISPEKSKVLSKHFEKKWYVVYGVGPTVSVYDKKIIVVPGVQVTFGRKLIAF